MTLPSCDRCRHRKVKCDRAQPSCSNCSQASIECIYPHRKGRAPKRPRTGLHPQLAQRLSRLEEIIRQASAPASQEVLQHEESSLDGSFGRLIINEKSSYYVSHIVWSSLATEVEELRSLLLEPGSEDGSEQAVSPSDLPGSGPPTIPGCGPNAILFGHRMTTNSLHYFYPSLPQAASLFAAFVENVAPLVRIFHMPSLTRIYWDAITSTESLDTNTEALLFAVHYAAAISMSSSQCVDVFGLNREDAVDWHRAAVEQALAQADLLNTQSLIVLQAAAVFLTALRNQDESRTTWSLTSLVYHIAQAMGLHRDGEAFGLQPFETELRRRLWWHIIILDSRSSEYHGYEPIVQEFAFDTKPPLHINDSDLAPDMRTPPAERWNEATDMTFTLIRCETMKAGWRMGLKSRRAQHATTTEAVTQQDGEAQLDELKQGLRDKFVQHCNESATQFNRGVSAAVAELIINSFWLLLHYPLVPARDKRSVSEVETEHITKSSAATLSTDLVTDKAEDSMQDRLFQISISILEISGRLLTDPQTLKWAWYSTTHIHWAAVALVLSELCTRPFSTEYDRAWTAVNVVYEAWQMRQNRNRSTLSLAIRKLMAKVRNRRKTSQSTLMSGSGGKDPQLQSRRTDSTVPPASVQTTLSTLPDVTSGRSCYQQAAPTNSAEMPVLSERLLQASAQDNDHMMETTDIEGLDNFLDFQPEDFHITGLEDIYGNTTTSNHGAAFSDYTQMAAFGQFRG